MRETTVIRSGDGGGGGDRGYVDWGAIFAGAAIAAGVSVIMTAFAAALGLGSISDEGVSGFGLVLTALFTVISMVAAYMLGGYIAGRMRRRVDGAASEEVTARDGIHGLVVWSLGTLLGGFLAVSAITGGAKAVGSAAGTAIEAAGSAVGGIAQGAGNLAGGAISGVGQAVGGVASGAGQAAGPALADMLPQGMTSNPLDYITDTLLRPAARKVEAAGSPSQAVAQTPIPGSPTGTTVGEAAARPTPATPGQTGDVRAEIVGILANVLRTGEISDADRNYAAELVAQHTNLSKEEVDQRVNSAIDGTQKLRAEAEAKLKEVQDQAAKLKADAEQAAAEAKQKAIDAAETARHSAILSAFLLAASSLIAAAAAYIGAVKGGRHRDEGKLWKWLTYSR
ncbi:hypothetical protein DRW48_14305 [Paracoccus suum]|uniref:PhnA-like protein n=1 Tax=Paracoccus suum TaxID=2259340 RepID=A0A344PPK5_9RHOB|nr:hypothetical protein [Paracoccus suum]AXC51310.1 hypothetical protein DRW48_14305 [Paracoccus suum]